MMNPINDEDKLLPLSGLQHYAFCPRQWALIHLEQSWEENVRTMEGRFLHEKVHSEDIREKRKDLIIARSVPMVSHRLGVFGIADVVEYQQVDDVKNCVRIHGQKGCWKPCPVEYKRGKGKVEDVDRIQVCAQAICLEEMNDIDIEIAYIYYGMPRRREEVILSPTLKHKTLLTAKEMHKTYTEGLTPLKLKAQKGCTLCSLKEKCMPSISKRQTVAAYMNRHLAEITTR